MAIQFAPPSQRKSFGAALGEALGGGIAGFGTGLGSGIGQGLQLLAQDKFNALKQRESMAKIVPAFQSLGFKPEEAAAIAMMPEAIQKEIISQKLKAPQQQAYLSALQALLGGGQLGGPGVAPQAELGELGEATLPQGLGSLLGGAGLNEKQATELTKIALQQQEKAQKQAAVLRKEAFQEKQFTTKQKLEAHKFTKPVTTEIIKGAKAAQDSQKRLDRMEVLNKRGNLSSPLYLEGLKKLHIDIPALTTADTQEFEKLSIDFLKNAREVFGSRVTNFDAATFLKTVPSLSQSPEGRERVIKNLRLMNEAALERDNARREVVKESGGTPPLDLEEKIEEKADPKLNLLAQEFKKEAREEQQKVPAIGLRLNQLPRVGDYEVGDEITDRNTGQVYINNGSTWTVRS